MFGVWSRPFHVCLQIISLLLIPNLVNVKQVSGACLITITKVVSWQELVKGTKKGAQKEHPAVHVGRDIPQACSEPRRTSMMGFFCENR